MRGTDVKKSKIKITGIGRSPLCDREVAGTEMCHTVLAGLNLTNVADRESCRVKIEIR